MILAMLVTRAQNGSSQQTIGAEANSITFRLMLAECDDREVTFALHRSEIMPFPHTAAPFWPSRCHLFFAGSWSFESMSGQGLVAVGEQKLPEIPSFAWRQMNGARAAKEKSES